MENSKITVASSPHVKANLRVNILMRDVLIALLPVVAAGVYYNGLNALILILVTIVSAMLSEVVFKKLMHKKHSLHDLSAAVTGTILGLILPVETPLWLGALGAVFAIMLVKEVYGGLGQNFMNPAAAGMIFLITAYGRLIVATPFENNVLSDVLIGQAGGNIGEASVAAILVGGIYLIVRGVIRVRVPAIVLLVNLLFSSLFLGDVRVLGMNPSIYLVAFFLANDYASSAITQMGKYVYATLLGLLIFVMAGQGGNPIGAYYALLVANVFAPFIDTFFKGKVNTKKEANA